MPALAGGRRECGFIVGVDRGQQALLPPCFEDYVAPEALVRVVNAFVAGVDWADLGFDRAVSAITGYGRAAKVPSYNFQSVVDVESGLIVNYDVFNDAK